MIITNVFMPRVLIIEEQEKIKKSLVSAFKREGYDICNGIGWESAAEFITKNNYDLVIIDLEVKPTIGFEMLKTIKLSNPNTEVVALFHPNEYDLGHIISCGVYDYVLKPFLLRDVVNIGKKALEKKQLSDRVRNLEQIVDKNKLTL